MKRLGVFWLGFLGLVSCSLEQMFPEPVGAAVARLSVRNLSYFVSMLSDDADCGFSSAGVKESVVIEGEVGQIGTMTWAVTECRMSFGPSELVKENCIGEKVYADGTVMVNATRVVEGLITGDEKTPILPTSPDAVKLEVSADFSDFSIVSSSADTAITFLNAKINFDAQIHLAVAESNGLCSVPASNLTFKNIKYGAESLVKIKNGAQIFEVPVQSSSFDVQLGKYGDKENYLSGTVEIWEKVLSVPEISDGPVLDPEYDADVFFSGFSCTEDLGEPLSFACKDIEPALANGIAQLSIRDFAMAALLTEADENCGFSAPQILNNPQVTGDLGKAGGEAVYSIVNPCRIDVPVSEVVSEECTGAYTSVSGSFVVTGTKTLRGIVTGDRLQPIVPQSRDPATISLEIQPIDFVAEKSTSTQSVLLKNGVLRGTFKPRTGLDYNTGACSMITPVTTFEAIELLDADVVLNNGGLHFAKKVNASRVNAQNGQKGARENELTGTIEMENKDYSVPMEGKAPTLDPNYDPQAFLDSYSCMPNLSVVNNDAECDFSKPLAEGMGRLIVQSVGTITSMINGDNSCGFDDLWEEVTPIEVIGDSGEMGSITWLIENCVLGNNFETEVARDCLGGVTYQEGFADINARRKVVGLRESEYLIIDSIQPLNPQSVEMQLDNVSLTEFTSFTLAAGENEPEGKLTLHSGVLDAVVKPLLGEMQSEPGRFMIATPVAVIDEAVLRNAVATLESGGKTFSVIVEEARLYAVNGSVNGETNLLQGYIYINGRRRELVSLPLNPAFEPAVFNAAYSCTEDLLEVLDE